MPLLTVSTGEDYSQQIERAAGVLGEGGVVVLPTETLYGAAGRLDKEAARERLRRLRPGGQRGPFTIHLAAAQDAGQYLAAPSELGRRMIRKLWPGPVALVFEVGEARREEVAAALRVDQADLYNGQTITLRCPDHSVARDVIAQAKGPVVATTAGEGLAAASMADELDGKVDLVLDAGPTRYARPSTIVRVSGQKWEIIRSGVWDGRIIQRLLRTTVLFVCSGNTCRSPMAQGIAEKLIAEKLQVAPKDLEKKDISVISAGTFAMPGMRASSPAIAAAAQMGVDISPHHSRTLSVELIHQADVIFTMGAAHSQTVTALVPSAADKVRVLDPQGDIEDPIGGDVALYRQLAERLAVLIQERLRDIPLV